VAIPPDLGIPRDRDDLAADERPSPERSDIDMLGAILFWIIVGLIAGALAKWILPGDDPGGIILTIVIGIVGAVIGGYILRLVGLGAGGGTGQWIGSIIAGFIGAVILLAIYRLVANRVT
jgi:uncharacterized membrane protein YeaQ/YmgE (transglycosylase-associated protein family)